MTNKKITIKIARVLRKYFDFTFIESQKVAKAIVGNCSFSIHSPIEYISASEEKFVYTLFEMAMYDWNSPSSEGIKRVLGWYPLKSVDLEPYMQMYGHFKTTYMIINLKTNHSFETTIEE